MKKNILIIILIIIVIILSALLIIKYNKDSESKLGDFDKVIELDKEKDDTDDITSNNSSNDSNTKEVEKDIIEKNSEEDVVNYFSDIENEVNNESKLDIFKTKFKDYFTNIVDFIFYDKEIMGYKFKDLTTTAKLRVIAAAIKIDSKIDEKIPNYKDALGSKYQDIKSDLVMSYLDLTVSICSKYEEGCDKAKEIFKEIKTQGKIGLNYIKDALSKGKNKLKDYYEIYRNS